MSQVERALRPLRSSEGGLLVLAALVGLGAGLGAVGFRWLIVGCTRVLTGYDDYSGLGHVASRTVPWLGPFFVLFTPVVAGIIYGPIVQRWAREARGHGVPEVMVAVSRNRGQIKGRVALVKALASALTIGGGGSVGREGPIVQIGSALGSSLGRWVRADEDRTRVLVACGAAGGIAATFNAPLAGVFFAMELILSDFAARSFGMVVVSSVTASVVGRAALGDDPFLRLPAFAVQHLDQYALFAVLGVLAGVVGVGFSRTLYLIEDACDAVWARVGWPEWARPASGGMLLGVVLLALPQLYGVGYPVLGDAVGGRIALGLLLLLLVGKVIATSLTIGIGGSGGVFAPSLFIGAMLGAAYGDVAGKLLPGTAGAAATYAVVGMGAVFAGSARAPITAVVILFELTGEYSVILPIMLAVALATGVSHLLSHDTIYTRKLLRRGIDLEQDVRLRRLRSTPLLDVMGPVGDPAALPVTDAGATTTTTSTTATSAERARVPAGTDLATALALVEDGGEVEVVDARGQVVGVFTRDHVTTALGVPSPSR